MNWLNEKQARKHIPDASKVVARWKTGGPFFNYFLIEYFKQGLIGVDSGYGVGKKIEFLRLDGPERKGRK